MSFSKALYYPFIDIENEDWIKTTILFWDEISTIVPASVNEPYKTNTTQYLSSEGIIKPIIVNSDDNVIRELSDSVLDYIYTDEGIQTLTNNRQKRSNYSLYPEKLPYEVQHHLREFINANGNFSLGSDFSNYYMTLLANKISEEKGISLLTEYPLVSNLSDKIRMDNQLILNDEFMMQRSFNRIRPKNLAQGLLTNLVIKNVGLSETTSINDILLFKKNHRDELGLFRTNLSKLVKNISDEDSIHFEALQQKVLDIYNDEYLPSLNTFTKALDGSRIKWFFDNIIRISMISASPAIAVGLLGLSVPQAVLAISGISIVSTAIMYNADKRREMQSNPYSYLVQIKKELR